jgi:uncharacterized membrane protein HdeD (DUF308 family)
MNQRPLSVTILSCLLIVAGGAGLIAHHAEYNLRHPLQNGALWIILIRLLAVVCGIYMLRGSNWARWVALLWLAFHVVISSFDSLAKLAFHAALLLVFAYFLFRASASRYFRTPPVAPA